MTNVHNDDSTTPSKKPDFCILILGVSGDGRSQLANELLGREVMRVDSKSSHQSMTRQIQTAAMSEDSELHRLAVKANCGRAVIVDTPGFDNTECKDMDVLQAISDWMIQGYARRDYIGIIVIVHDICRSNNPTKYLRLLQGLIGDFAFPNVVIGTTKHGIMGHTTAAARSISYQSSHWKTFIEGGATVACVDSPNAQDPILQCMRNWSFRPVLMQVEVAMQQKSVQMTSAGRAFRRFLTNDIFGAFEILEEDSPQPSIYSAGRQPMLAHLDKEEQLAQQNSIDRKTFEQMWHQNPSNDCNLNLLSERNQVDDSEKGSTLRRLSSKIFSSVFKASLPRTN